MLGQSVVVKVTADDIQHGVCADKECCAVAIAIKRALEPLLGEVHAFVHRYMARVTMPGGTMFFMTIPEAINLWIGKFDLGETVEPIRFASTITKDNPTCN